MERRSIKPAARLHLLTAREVHKAAHGDHADGGGLMLRCGNGSASWVLRYTAPSGRRREMGFGPASRGSVADAGATLTAARRQAHAARELLGRGVDPLDERDRQRQAAREAEEARKSEVQAERWTLARCARDYHERVIERTRTVRHAATWIQSLETHVPPAIWNAPIDNITPPALLQALEAAKPHERARRAGDLAETLRRVRQRIDAVCEDAVFHGRASTNPAAALKRKLSESRPAARAEHLRALDYQEAPALLARVRAMPGVAARALEFAVLCASRTAEVLGAEWGEFDLEAATWTIPGARMKARMKTRPRPPHRIFLSPRALAIVKAQAGQGARYIFPSPQASREGRPLSSMSMLVVLDRLGARGLTTVHGLARASFSSWANETNTGRPDVVEACLAHAEENAVRRAYLRSTFDAERRSLLSAWSEYLGRPVLSIVAA